MNYLLYGNEAYLLQKRLDQLIKEHVKAQDTMNTIVYDASENDFSLRKVVEEASTFPFFSDHKVVVVNNSIFLTRGSNVSEPEMKDLEQYFITPSDFCSIVFVHHEENIDTVKKIYKLIRKYCQEIHVKKLETPEFRSFLKEQANLRGLQFDNEAFNELVARLDNQMFNAIGELNKLKLFGNQIRTEDVRALVSRPLDNETFHLINALIDKDLGRCLHIWNDMVVLNVEPLSFMGLIASQLRLMYQVLSLHQQGFHRQDIVNTLLNSSTKVEVWRVSKLLSLAQATDSDRLLYILNVLAQLDQKSKSGQVDKRFGFELFLIEATR
ncbi:MAG: DNA polymerase III subunit delta [Erysipelotrichales bacterium]|nr:MAG: DNA polymerase III subunit delta [Erysipelotrichales bacterium]